MKRLTKYESVAGHAHAIPIVDADIAIQKLAELEDLAEQGRLPILPCVVGDTVYAIMIVGLEFGRLKYQVYEVKVVRHRIDSFHLCVEMITENGQRIELVAETFGETVFPTREEAEVALEKMKGEEHE